MLDIANMIFNEVCDLEFNDYATGAYLGTASELQDMKIANSQDEVYALGKNEAKLSAFGKNKGVKLSGTSGQFEQFLLGLQTGSGMVVGDAEYEKSQVLVVGATNTVKIKYTATAIKTVATVTANGNVIKSLEQAEALSSGKFTFATATGVLTFSADVVEGTKVRVVYKTISTDAVKITNDTKTFSKVVSITGNTVVVDGCSNTEYLAQLVMPKAKVSGTFDIDLKGEPAVQSFEIEALTGCGQSNLWDLIIAEDESFSIYA
jgi:hypothetical protein